jgi:hypothetical protein
VLHHHVAGAILVADVVEHADVRVVERSHGAGFALEALPEVLALGDMFGQDLDGDEAIEARVTRFVHFAHTPGAKWREDFVRAKLFAC